LLNIISLISAIFQPWFTLFHVHCWWKQGHKKQDFAFTTQPNTVKGYQA